MSDNITSYTEESTQAQPQDSIAAPVGGMKPGQLAPIELSAWLMIKEGE